VAAESSPPDDASTAAALDRVAEEVRSRPPSRGLDADDARKLRLEAREQAERYWAVSAERELLSAPGAAGRGRGLLAAPVKIVVRRLLRWYVEPALAEQRHFNAAILRLLDDLNERMVAIEERKTS
jgi:hypothetical protein